MEIAATSTTSERRPFMDCFYALADVDDSVRQDAVVDLLHYLKSKKHHESIVRILRSFELKA